MNSEDREGERERHFPSGQRRDYRARWKILICFVSAGPHNCLHFLHVLSNYIAHSVSKYACVLSTLPNDCFHTSAANFNVITEEQPCIRFIIIVF